MKQGDFSSASITYWQITLATGLLAGGIGMSISFTPLFRHYNPAISFAIITFLFTYVAYIINHSSRFGGFSGEALATRPWGCRDQPADFLFASGCCGGKAGEADMSSLPLQG
jgi:hypothetical protein